MSIARFVKPDGERVPILSPGDFSVTETGAPRKAYFGTNKGNMYLPDKEGIHGIVTSDVAAISAYMSTNDIWIDGNRTDDYTADGSSIYPYKTISAAVTAHASDTTPISIRMSPATYTETADVTLPNVPITVYGNNSTISASGHTITIPNPNLARYNLFTTANVVYNNFATGARCAMYGGGITGNITVNSYAEFIQCQLNGGTVTTGATGQCVVSVCSPTSKFVSTGILMFNGININTGYAGYLVTSTAGFFSSANSIIYNTSTNAAAGGIFCDNGAAITAPNMIVNTSSITAGGGATAFGINAGTAYTQYSKNNASAANVLYALYGTHLIPVASDIIGPSAIGIGSDATGDIYYRNAAGSLTRLAIGTSGQTLKVSSGGLPAWTT